MQTFTKKVITDKRVRGLCKRPYPNHPKGCPNFGNRPTCPPQCPKLSDIYDIDNGFWIVWIDFNFKSHCDKMKKKHPDWTQRQIECCLYWQGTANKQLKEAVSKKLCKLNNNNWRVTYCPEAMGVNVTATMRNIGVKLEWPPKNVARKIAFIGVRSKAYK